jgi:hypothetical protein
MIPLHLSNPLLVSFEREMLQASWIFPSHFEMFNSSFAPCKETNRITKNDLKPTFQKKKLIVSQRTIKNQHFRRRKNIELTS